jgi:hypothetical protein
MDRTKVLRKTTEQKFERKRPVVWPRRRLLS